MGPHGEPSERPIVIVVSVYPDVGFILVPFTLRLRFGWRRFLIMHRNSKPFGYEVRTVSCSSDDGSDRHQLALCYFPFHLAIQHF